MKICGKCQIIKNDNDFDKDKNKRDGFQTICKYCKSEHEKNYRKNNQKELKQRRKLYRLKNIEKFRFYDARKRAAELKRTPNYADLKAIKQFYINCPKGMVVDHIIPLQGENISGFHILKNLQYLSKEENMKKSNMFPYYSEEFYMEKGLL